MSTTTSSSAPVKPTAAPRRRQALTMAGATLAAAVPWLLAQATGTDLEVTIGGQAPMVIRLPFVIVTALVASLAGWGALALLRRLTSRARSVWTALALAALLGSFAPVLLAETSAQARAYLALMHLAVAAVLIPGLRGTATTTTVRSAS